MRSEAGFTLLEVMVAFAIAALASLVLFRGGLDGAANARAAARTEEAITRAESRLASVGTLTPLRAGTFNGDDGGGFAWRLVIAPAARSGIFVLYKIVLTETYDGRTIRLSTARLASGA
jgi:general secretion pathway protein I